MDAFKDTSALRKAVSFIIPAIHVSSGSDSEKTLFLLQKYITNNVSLNLSVKDVADYVHLSPEYFTKLFKKEVGQNIKSYILQVKVEIAKDLLGNPNIPISMVALDLGYSNFSHFTQVFKNWKGSHQPITVKYSRGQLFPFGFRIIKSAKTDSLLYIQISILPVFPYSMNPLSRNFLNPFSAL